jgi:UDP-N-acetylglucosamine 2-epimerase
MIKKILHIVGTRPQYIKLFPLWSKMKSLKSVEQRIYDTGQHYDEDMSKNLLHDFGIDEVVTGYIAGLGPGKQIPLMIENIWSELTSYEPDYVVIYGDTNTTLCASIACAKLEIPFGHVEAGVRTLPHVGIQEGINRKATDHMATHNFCITKEDLSNLLDETLSDQNNFLSGDVMFDTYTNIKDKYQIKPQRQKKILVTIHRAEHVDQAAVRGLLIKTLIELSKSVEVILPMHPRLRSKITEYELSALNGAGITICNPLSYIEIVKVLNTVTGVVTDSGGLPKDAAYAGVRAVLLRDDPVFKDLFEKKYFHPISDLIDKTPEELARYCLDVLTELPHPYVLEKASDKIANVIKGFLGV